MKPTRVRLFIKPYCPWCSKATDWLDARGVDYEIINVMADDKAYDEMERLSGQTCAPTIEVDGKVLGDFGPPEIEKWWKKNNFD